MKSTLRSLSAQAAWRQAWTLVVLVVVLSTAGHRGAAAADFSVPAASVATGRNGMVVSVSPDASDAGRQVLKQGGNAVDAAVATAFALAVTFPEAGNIGGGGFMLVWPGDGRDVMCIDYRETAPAASSTEMYRPAAAQLGPRTVGVPGTVRGLALAHETYGRLEWRALLRPAIRLAVEGFVVDAAVAEGLNETLADKATTNAEFRRVFARADGRPWKAGERLTQPDLARTLHLIADGGPDAFYHGPIAELIAAEMRRGRGLIALDDLANYWAVARTPVHGTFHGYDVYGPPPPSSGGTVVVEALNLLENFDLAADGPDSPRTGHRIVEAMRRAFCDRARYLGDPDFIEIPERLTSKEYARELAAGIDADRATPSDSLAPEIDLVPEGESTTHFSVVDGQGMAVANTYTLQDSWGSRVVVEGGGFLLNNEMTDFNWRPGSTDRRGGIGTPANLIAPGKRMLSSQSPTIVARDGELLLVTGSPGGRTIPNTVISVLLGVLEFDLDLRAAVEAPRWHHQWLPDVVGYEGAGDDARKMTIAELEARGHRIRKPRRQGDAHSIIVRDGTITGVADGRRSQGKASGF